MKRVGVFQNMVLLQVFHGRVGGHELSAVCAKTLLLQQKWYDHVRNT
jgi:hypothetical protein